MKDRYFRRKDHDRKQKAKAEREALAKAAGVMLLEPTRRDYVEQILAYRRVVNG